MSVGQASGVALLTAAEAGCRVVEYTSNEVKLAVAGLRVARRKEQVQKMVAALLALPELPRPPMRRTPWPSRCATSPWRGRDALSREAGR